MNSKLEKKNTAYRIELYLANNQFIDIYNFYVLKLVTIINTGLFILENWSKYNFKRQ